MEEDLDGSYKKLKTLNTKNQKGSKKIKNHCIRDQVNKGRLKLLHCPTAIYEADIPTKFVKHDKFEELRNKMGVASLEKLVQNVDQRVDQNVLMRVQKQPSSEGCSEATQIHQEREEHMKNIMNIKHSDEEHNNILMFILGTQQHYDVQNVHPDFQVKACGAQDTWHNTIGHLTTAI
ncbi:hypothetical protein MTR_5g086290 [Medicago truncatula]|uniref:Uncharacterized protein n=1 Tax=Medicago truncatula TaxID=3880 RepID=G7KCL9_MEDTR|nr:hypothetical protein MTR_5g086290 [Medicago truncatula]